MRPDDRSRLVFVVVVVVVVVVVEVGFSLAFFLLRPLPFTTLQGTIEYYLSVA